MLNWIKNILWPKPPKPLACSTPGCGQHVLMILPAVGKAFCWDCYCAFEQRATR